MQFFAIVWPPLFSYRLSVLDDISKIYHIDSSKEFQLNENHFSKFINGIYKPDKTPEKRIKKKIKVMTKYPLSLCLILFTVDNPTMLSHKKARLKGKYFCQETKKMKSDLRDKYVPFIKDYVYDVAIHVGDNQEHTDICIKIGKKLNIF